MENIFELSSLAIACVPVVLALTELVKRFVNKKYAPLFSILFGVALMALTNITWQAFLVQGLIVGLMSSGLYSSVKKLTE